ncbi:hypothetical protein [Lyngbya sp. CCY1209]|uniref:hypothetical protein n=1 Tax=Lyngbya sp. CCY1209 TaxID=2886103 RepID=UPI002D21668B|nr:hypothetical protein [Lyngbya sp. CCY1209]MEB3884584.1 hypothetical protein [Lyngbya sp. CCY1209]
MSASSQPSRMHVQPSSRWTGWNKFVAIVAAINLILVLFNLSYIPLRNTYIRHFPAIVRLYDPVKSIQPHPDTTRYLNTVDALKMEVAKSGLASPSVDPIFISLRNQSEDLLVENPFSISGQFSTFATLQKRMEYRLETSSTKRAFDQFWSRPYLGDVGWTDAISFFDEKIRPLMAVSYYRDFDENGVPIDYFWRIDLAFIILFAIDFAVKTLRMSWRHPGMNWWGAMLRRSYDIPLFLPFWRWLRVVPVFVRLHRSKIIDLEDILAAITHEPAAYLADRVSVFLVVRLLNQTQDAVNSGELARALLAPPDASPEANKIDRILDRIIQLSLYNVLPQVQPDLETLLHYSLKESLKQSDFYQTFQNIPGLESLPSSTIENLADYLSHATYTVLINSYSDVVGRELFDRLSQHFGEALKRELRQKSNQSELQGLISDILEELKLNYVQKSDEQDPELTMEEAETIRHQAKH